MKFFEDKGIIGKYLEMIYNYFFNIFLVRVELERIFIVVGKVFIKIYL